MRKNFVLFVLAMLVIAGPAMAQSKDVNHVGNYQPPNFGLVTGTHCTSPTPPLAFGSVVGAPTNHTQAVVSAVVINDLELGLQFTHTWVGDVSANLTHAAPEGGAGGTTVVGVLDRPGFTTTGFGCSLNDVDATLSGPNGTAPVEGVCTAPGPPAISGVFTPNASLAPFSGQVLGGSWTLALIDHAAGDTGTLVTWCLSNKAPVGTGGADTGGGDTGGGDTGGGTGTPATNAWGVGILIALFLGVSVFYLRRRGASHA